MYNRVILVGNLTRDVEIRYSQSGSAIGKVGIATNRRFKAANGEQRDETMFIDLTFFGRTAEIANQYLRKGSKVLVEGRLVLEQWTAQDGTKRSKHSITVDNLQMLDRPGENQGGGSNYGGGESYNQGGNSYQQPTAPAAAPSQPQQPAQPSVPEIDIDEDEIPF
jgi:single-strand DNA-binding protein